MPAPASACSPSFRCAACGAETGEGRLPFRCPASGRSDDIDHIVVPAWQHRRGASRQAESAGRGAKNPYVRFRDRLSATVLARAHGWSDDQVIELVERLDRRIAELDGHGFVETPFGAQPSLARAIGLAQDGTLLVKDETGNVSGSHKARHLMGVMLYLLVAEALNRPSSRPPLAIASCGNAALAAAVVSRAADWPLEVFVPPSAHPSVLARLNSLGARIHTCHREAGVSGDPCYLAFRRAVEAEGAIPFCCQGSDNGLTIEGGQTLAWEMVEQQPSAGPSSLGTWDPASAGADESLPPPFDAIFVQVGGGALASAVVQGFAEARRAGTIDRSPRVYAVQTAGGYPLVRAYDRLVARLVADWPLPGDPPSDTPDCLAEALAAHPSLIDDSLAFARRHRSSFMWPWEEEPRSVAHGILDDETYDWAAVVEGMLRTAGRPVVVGEERLRQANDLARRESGIDVDHTGSAGLAGLMEVLEQEPGLRSERVAVIFSGVRR